MPVPSLKELAQRRHGPQSIFAARPAIGTATVDGEACAIPYHNYDADALIIWGSADAEWVRERLQGPWEPLLGTDGRAKLALWLVDYKDTVVNAYKELIVVFSVVPRSSPGVPPVRFAHQQLQLFDDKQACPYIYKLWLDEQLPVSYGRELLGCDKYLDRAMKLDFAAERGEVRFDFHHVPGEANAPKPGPLLSGALRLADGMHLTSLVLAYGLVRTLGMAAGASSTWHVVNPPGVMKAAHSQAHNPVWDFVYETSPKFTTAKPDDELVYGGELAAMGFSAELYQHDPHIRAVLLPPWTMVPIGSDEVAMSA